MATRKRKPQTPMSEVGFGPTDAEKEILDRLTEIAEHLEGILATLETISEYGITTHDGR